MREWHITYSDPMAPRIAADARTGRTTYTDDQAWQLRLGRPDEPAISLETRYGGRVGMARFVPMWMVGRRQIYETQGYHSPPVLVAFAPDYLRVRAELTLAIKVSYEFWTMESQAVGGRVTCRNTGDQPQTLRLDLNAQVAREGQTLQMFFLTLENNQVALQLGRLDSIQPVLVLEGADQTATSARLSRGLTLDPGAEVVIRWVAGGLPDRDASLTLAYKWLARDDWDTYLARIDQWAAAAPQVETGHADWDLALAWSQQVVLRSMLGATGSLPHPSFVTGRKTGLGYAVMGTHSGGFNAAWGGQTVPDALHIAGALALAAPDLAKGVVQNFLAVQRDDGWIDAKPGLDGQRANVLAPPLLVTLVYTVFHYTRDQDFLAACLDGLLAFFERWFKGDVDHDRDGVPEWSHAGQGAFADSPTLAQARRWAQGIEISTIEAPDLLAYLVREARTLLRICQILERDDVAREVRSRADALIAALGEFWDEDRGVFHYRDRDSHACPSGDVVFTGKGDEALNERTTLAQPSRLILRVVGGLSRKPALSCTIEGIGADGKPTNETIPAGAFNWYRGMGSATTGTVWGTITHLGFGGLSRVFKVEVNTVNLSLHDQSLLVPLWSGALDDERAARVIAMLTDPDQYWREYGISGCPASSPVYDASHQNGCGGLWPAWNARLAWALIDRGRTREAADLFTRLMRAQARSLGTEQAFRALYNPDTGEGMGDSDAFEGAVSWDWFARLFGAYVLDRGSVALTGPFCFAGEAMTWTQHGVTLERRDDGTRITFPSGHTLELPPDADAQFIHDPNVRPGAASRAATPGAPPDDPPSVVRPDEGLLPDGV